MRQGTNINSGKTIRSVHGSQRGRQQPGLAMAMRWNTSRAGAHSIYTLLIYALLIYAACIAAVTPARAIQILGRGRSRGTLGGDLGQRGQPDYACRGSYRAGDPRARRLHRRARCGPRRYLSAPGRFEQFRHSGADGAITGAGHRDALSRHRAGVHLPPDAQRCDARFGASNDPQPGSTGCSQHRA